MSSLDKSHEAVSISSDSEESAPSVDTTQLDKAYRKIDLLLLPLLFLGFFGLQLDRGNIANAITDTLLQDLKITTDTINVGTQLLSAGIVIFEIPSNILLQRIGPRKWITGQIIAWGLVATLQAYVKTRSTFLLTRFLLGACESGFIPGTLYYLSSWYRKEQYAKRNTVFFLGNQLGSACSGLLASGILKLGGKNGNAGWQWLFIVDGTITIFVGVLWLFLLPESPTNSSSLLLPKWRLLSEETGNLVQESLLVDDPEKSHIKIRIGLRQVLQVLSNWRIWQHLMISFIPLTAACMSTYFPTIAVRLGYSKIEANAMTSIGYFLGVPFQLGLAFFSDITRYRGIAVIIPEALATIFVGCMVGVTNSKGQFALVTLCEMTFLTLHILNVTWTSANCVSPIERSISMAALIMSANLAGVAGAPIYARKYAPSYHISFIISLVLMCCGTLLSIGTSIGYIYSNRKIKLQKSLESLGAEETTDATDVSVSAIKARRRLNGILYVW